MAFVSEWKTDNPGTSNDDQITLPLVPGGTYNFYVQWGDGNDDTITTWDQAEKTHTYAIAGTYTVTITGTITGWFFNNGGDCQKILDVSEWGVLRLTNTGSYFHGCANLDCSAVDSLVTTGITTFDLAFCNCTSLTALDVSGWVTSSVTTFDQAFYNCTSLTALDTSGWVTSSVTTFDQAFYNCTSLTALDVSGWDTSLVTTFYYAFYNCTSLTALDVSGWDITGVTTFGGFLRNVTLTRPSYDAMLVAFELQAVQSAVPFHGGNSTYTPDSAASVARAALIADHTWAITDGGAAPERFWVGEVFHAGAVAGRNFVAGGRAGEVFHTGAAAGQIKR